MAYNPFDFFRRNQKSFFAILTAFVMVMFVFSFGQGDLFQWLPKWLGSQRAAGKTLVATIDGRKFTDAELYRHDDGRAMANQFMQQANGAATNNLAESIKEGIARTGVASKESFQQLLSTRQTAYIDPQILQLIQNNPNIDRNMLTQFQQRTIGDLRTAFGKLLSDGSTASNEDKTLAQSALSLMELDSSAATMGSYGYFNNLPNTKTNGERLEFELWLRKADKLGIVIPPSEVPELLQKEFSGRLKNADVVEIEKGFQSNRSGFSRESLMSALADEFRVRTAMTVVIGPVIGKSGSPAVQAFATPYEAYQHYREKCDSGLFAVMTVPTANYLDKVPGAPTESELQVLFDKYRKDEPNPARETPGLKEPRKLKLGWLEVTGDEPFYKTMGEETLKLSEIGFRLYPIGMGGLEGPIATAVVATAADPSLQAAYTKFKTASVVSTDNNWFPSSFGKPAAADVSVMRPANLVSAAAAAAGSMLSRSGPFTMPLIFEEQVAAADRQERARVFASLFASPTVGGSSILATTIVAGARMPDALPLAVVRNQLKVEVQAALTRNKAEEDVSKFQIELGRLGAKKDKEKSEARTYLDKFLTTRGVKSGASKEFRDMFAIDKDEGLAPLAVKLDRGRDPSTMPMKFGPSFFFEADPSGARRAGLPLTYFNPKPFPEQGRGMDFFSLKDGEPSYLVWRTEEIESKEPRELAPIRAKVEAVWRHLKARDMAKAGADDLRKKLDEKLVAEKAMGQQGAVDRVTRDVQTTFVAENYKTRESLALAQYFFVEDVAYISSKISRLNAMGGGVQQFVLSPRKEVEYPTQAMTTDLLAAKDKPLGTTLIMTDNPKDNYYVAVLLNRDERATGGFYSEIYGSNFGPLSGAVNQSLQSETLRKAREQSVTLLKSEFKVENENLKFDDKEKVE